MTYFSKCYSCLFSPAPSSQFCYEPIYNSKYNIYTVTLHTYFSAGIVVGSTDILSININLHRKSQCLSRSSHYINLSISILLLYLHGHFQSQFLTACRHSQDCLILFFVEECHFPARLIVTWNVIDCLFKITWLYLFGSQWPWKS